MKFLYSLLIVVILSPLFILADPYCSNGRVGVIDILQMRISNPVVISYINNPGLIEWEVKVNNTGNQTIEVIAESYLIDLDTNQIVFNDTKSYSVDQRGRYIGSGRSMSFSLPSGSNENHNFRFYVKVYERNNESINCNESNIDARVRLFREVLVDSFEFEPSYLNCSQTYFNATVSVVNRGAAISDVYLTVSDHEGSLDMGQQAVSLDISQQSVNFSLAENERKTFIFPLELPGFHLYRHTFKAYANSYDINSPDSCIDGNRHLNCGQNITDLVIAKCPTDNAQDVREKVNNIEIILKRVQDDIVRLFKCLGSMGAVCPAEVEP